MKKLKNCGGFSLIEMLAAIAILAIMVAAMGSGLSAGVNAYREAVFFANSRTMADTINIAVSDTLRYGDLVRYSSKGNFTSEKGIVLPGNYVFSNFERGIINGYLNVAAVDGVQVIQVNDLQGSDPKQLINMGAYPGMQIDNLKVTFNPLAEDGVTVHKNCFAVSYEILDMEKTDREHFKVETTIRLLNPIPEETTEAGSGIIPTTPPPPPTEESGTEQGVKPAPKPGKIPEDSPSLADYSTWDSETYYLKGDIVTYGNQLYVAKEGEIEEDEDDHDDINCNKNPSGNKKYWIKSEIWDPDKPYKEDDIVVYGQTAYEAEKASKGKTPPEYSKYWEKYPDDEEEDD